VELTALSQTPQLYLRGPNSKGRARKREGREKKGKGKRKRRESEGRGRKEGKGKCQPFQIFWLRTAPVDLFSSVHVS